MKLQDLITLATQGYKLAEIKELVALADNGQEEDIQEAKDSATESSKADEPEKDEKAGEPEDVVKDVVDYKTLYEEEKKKVEELQNANIRKDNSGNEGEDPDKVLEDIVRNFM